MESHTGVDHCAGYAPFVCLACPDETRTKTASLQGLLDHHALAHIAAGELVRYRLEGEDGGAAEAKRNFFCKTMHRNLRLTEETPLNLLPSADPAANAPPRTSSEKVT